MADAGSRPMWSAPPTVLCAGGRPTGCAAGHEARCRQSAPTVGTDSRRAQGGSSRRVSRLNRPCDSAFGGSARKLQKVALSAPTVGSHCRLPLPAPTAGSHCRLPLSAPTVGFHCRRQLAAPTTAADCRHRTQTAATAIRRGRSQQASATDVRIRRRFQTASVACTWPSPTGNDEKFRLRTVSPADIV